MALKSYRLKDTMKKRKKKLKPSFVRDATGAILGVALVSEVATVIRRL